MWYRRGRLFSSLWETSSSNACVFRFRDPTRSISMKHVMGGVRMHADCVPMQHMRVHGPVVLEQQLLAEIAALLTLDHPHIVKVSFDAPPPPTLLLFLTQLPALGYSIGDGRSLASLLLAHLDCARCTASAAPARAVRRWSWSSSRVLLVAAWTCCTGPWSGLSTGLQRPTSSGCPSPAA